MIRRPLSPMERWYWICDQISPLNVIARVRVAGALAADDLERAGVALAAEHPLLRVAVAAEADGSRPRFVAATQARIPIRTVRLDGPDADRWQREVNDVELVSSVDWGSGPLARIVHIAQGDCHDLILTVSHIIADGTTALRLLRRLVELAAGDSARPREALPPPEAMLPKRFNGLARAAHLVAMAVADQVASAIARPGRLAPATVVAPDRRRTRLIRRELDAERLHALISRCRQEGVTVHSALAAAMAIAVSEVDDSRVRRVTIGSPVDFRAELVPPAGEWDAGAYVATVPSHIKVDPDLWATARGAQQDLRRRKRFRQHLALVRMLRLMSPRSLRTSGRAVALVDRAGPGNVCLSNIGRHDFPDWAGNWQLSGAQFIAGISISGYLVATVNTSHAALHWNFTYIDGAVPAERAEQIADRAMRALLSSVRKVDQHEQVGHGSRHRRVVGAG